jgi:hypothetical protein
MEGIFFKRKYIGIKKQIKFNLQSLFFLGSHSDESTTRLRLVLEF